MLALSILKSKPLTLVFEKHLCEMGAACSVFVCRSRRRANCSKKLCTYKAPGSGKFVAGWYKTLWGDLYVSKGVGTSVLPLRIGARPEISFFEIN